MLIIKIQKNRAKTLSVHKKPLPLQRFGEPSATADPDDIVDFGVIDIYLLRSNFATLTSTEKMAIARVPIATVAP